VSGSKDRRGHAGQDRTNFLPDSCGHDEGRDQGVPVFYDYIDCLRVPRIKLDFHETLGKQLGDNGGWVQAVAEREAELVLVYGFGSPRYIDRSMGDTDDFVPYGPWPVDCRGTDGLNGAVSLLDCHGTLLTNVGVPFAQSDQSAV
jgi:hypothetical protein